MEPGKLKMLPEAPIAYAETDEPFADAVHSLREHAIAGRPLEYVELENTIITGLSGLAKSPDALIRAWALHELMSLHSRKTKAIARSKLAAQHREKRLVDLEIERKKLQVGRKSRAGKKGAETVKVRAIAEQIQTPK
jgi:hypothetical protein